MLIATSGLSPRGGGPWVLGGTTLSQLFFGVSRHPCSFLNRGLAGCKTSLAVFVPFRWKPLFGNRTGFPTGFVVRMESCSSPGASPSGTLLCFLGCGRAEAGTYVRAAKTGCKN